MSLPYNLHNGAAQQSMLLLLLLSGGRGDGGKAREGVGGRHDGPWLVGACCGEGGAAGCGKGFVSLSLKENQKLKQKTKKLLSYTHCCGSGMFSPDP
jgi:hypothetical protein